MNPASLDSGGALSPLVTPVPAVNYAACIGIDWSNHQQVFALRANEPSTCWQKGSFVLKDLSSWISQLRQRFAGSRVAIAIEKHRGALIHALAAHADFVDLFLIPTTSAANYRKAFVPSGAKADEPDAEWLGDMLYHHQDRLKLWQADDADTRLLGALCQQRRQTVDERTRLSNQLTDKLKLHAPVVLELCEDIATAMGLELLRRWPSLAKLKAAKPATLRAFFYRHHVRRPQCVQKRLDLIAAATPLLTDPAVLVPAQLAVAALVKQLTALLPIIADYDQRIAELYGKHPDAFIFRSLPGAGPALGPRLLCAFGSRRERWPDAASIQTFSGIAPLRKASGNSCAILKRCGCPKYLRQSFHEFAASSIKFCQWANALYQRQRSRGKSYHTAVRAVAFRWLRILWRLWHDRTPYDEALIVKAQQQHVPTTSAPPEHKT